VATYDHLRELDRVIRQARERAKPSTLDAQFRDALAPYRNSTASLLAESGRPRALAAVAVPSTIRAIMEAAEAATNERQRHFDALMRVTNQRTRFLEEYRTQFLADMRTASEQLAASLQPDFRRLMDAVSMPLTRDAALITSVVDGWKDILQVSPSIEHRVAAAALANPVAASMRALTATATALGRQSLDARVERALERSIILLDAEVHASRELVFDLESEVDADTTVILPPPRRLYAPRLQRAELLRDVAAADLDLDELLVILPTGQLILLARELLSLVIEINESRQLAGQEPMFRMTIRVGRAFAELPFAVAVDEETFGDFVDDLYFLLYEAPGGGSLKYETKHAGPLTHDECAFVFVIKYLRNYYRHDLEHGSDRDIKKKFGDIAAYFRERGCDAPPRRRDEFRRLQRTLLEESVSFLDTINERLLQKSNDS